MPPQKKKPTSRAKPAARKSSARKPAARKPAPRKSAAKKTTRAPAKRATRPRSSLTSDPGELPSSARPVAVGSVRPLWETDEVAAPRPEEQGPPPPPIPAAKERPPVVDRPAVELGVAAFATLLGASVFLPWYHSAPGTVSGWSSGTWGPIIFFLAVSAIAIVLLRRQGIPVAFPIEPTLVIEAIGWVCVIALILKRYFPPKAFGFKLPTDGWLFLSMGLAIGLALLAGVASSNAAFVLRPGWWKGAGGRIGAAVLVVALAGGLSFGLTNTAVSTTIPQVQANSPAITSKGLPPCAKRLHVPTPNGFTAVLGTEIRSINQCAVQYSSSLSLPTAFDRFVGALRGSGWTVQAGRSSPMYRLASLSGPTCGSLTVAVTQSKVLVALVNLSPCPVVTPSK